jgi:hypothetical protein
MPYQILKRSSEVDTVKLKYKKYRDLWDVRYKPDPKNKSRAIYLQTPALKLSSIEENKDSYFLTCRVGSEEERFSNLIQIFEMAVMEDMMADMSYWGFDSERTMVNQVESRFIPTLKMSSVNWDYSIHLEIPKMDEVDVFDHEKTPMDMSLLRKDYEISMLLLLDGVERQNGFYRLKFILQQVKANVPQSVWQPRRVVTKGELLIEESEDDQESNYPLENSIKYSHMPKSEYSEDEDMGGE